MSEPESQEVSLPASLAENPVIVIPEAENNIPLLSDDVKLKLQNEQLRNDLILKQQECRQKDQTIYQLSNSTKMQEKKIDLLTAQLSRVELLMQELIKQTPSNLRKANQGFLSPEPRETKFNKEFDIQAALCSELKWDSEFLTSSKGDQLLKNQYLSTSRKKMQGGYLSSPYLQKSYLTSSSKKEGNFGEAMDLNKYRRQKLMSSKNLSDVMKLQKFMVKKQGPTLAI